MNCLALFVAFTMHIGLENEYNNVHPHARCTVDQYIGGVIITEKKDIVPI